MTLFEKHQEKIEDTIKLIRKGMFFTHYAELPTDRIYGENSIEKGYQQFKKHINRKFEGLRQAKPARWEGKEESPFFKQPLNVLYPSFEIDVLIERSNIELNKWRKIPPEVKAGLLMESLERIQSRFFEIAFATMHTSGMAYAMAFQISGPHAAQRAQNAIASGYKALKRYPETRFGRNVQDEFGIKLSKSWVPVPKGTSLIIGCPHFPSRDTVPSIYASLITGNPVIVKPHSSSVLPAAIVISEIQKVFSEHGFDPDICQLAVNTDDDEFIKMLIENKDIKLIDFKGNCMPVALLDSHKDKTVFVERFCINSIIIESVRDLDEVIKNLVISLALYSGQMSNTPQNFFIPEKGIQTSEGPVSYQMFVDKFIAELNNLIESDQGAQIMGAIQNSATIDYIKKIERQQGTLLFKSKPYKHPEYKNARTLSPMVMELFPEQKDLYQKEQFGPVGFFIRTKNACHSLELAAETAEKCGSLYCSVFTTNNAFKEEVIDKMTGTFTPVTFNMVGNIYLDPREGIENYHLTGGNTASIASASNLDFVSQRFRWVGCKQPVFK